VLILRDVNPWSNFWDGWVVESVGVGVPFWLSGWNEEVSCGKFQIVAMLAELRVNRLT
jgi:hypothetical protein